jgi:hypothetical protein
MYPPGMHRPRPDEKPVTLDLSRSPLGGRLAAEDISAETAREMQAAQLADARRGILWKAPLYVVGMTAIVLVYVLSPNRQIRGVWYAVVATGWFFGELFRLYRLSTIDPKRRLIEDELRKDD